jgi:hypothetical protein
MLFHRQSPDLAFTDLLHARRTAHERRLVFVDIEACGRQTWRPIMQIAAIAVDDNYSELEVFEEKIRFNEHQAVQWTLRKRHYSRVRWNREARRDRDVAVDFAGFLTRHATIDLETRRRRPFAVAQLVAHNAEFDGPFLRMWFERMGLFFPGAYRVFCTMQRAMWLFHEQPDLPPTQDFKLGTLCQYFGVPWNAAAAHDALADVRATVGLYRAMIQHSASRPCHSPVTLPSGDAAAQSSRTESPGGIVQTPVRRRRAAAGSRPA